MMALLSSLLVGVLAAALSALYHRAHEAQAPTPWARLLETIEADERGDIVSATVEGVEVMS